MSARMPAAEVGCLSLRQLLIARLPAGPTALLAVADLAGCRACRAGVMRPALHLPGSPPAPAPPDRASARRLSRARPLAWPRRLAAELDSGGSRRTGVCSHGDRRLARRPLVAWHR